jgi:hypothetical protein
MYCIESKFKDSWKNWFISEDVELKYRKCMIGIEGEQVYLNLPNNHDLILKIYKKEKFKDPTFLVYFYSETERILHKFITNRFLYTLENDQLINGFEMEVSEK